MSACLFLFIFLKLPLFAQFSLLPIFYEGLRDGVRSALVASGTAVILTLVIGHGGIAFIFMLLFLAPAVYLIACALFNRPLSISASVKNHDKEWYPLDLLIMQTIAICLLIMTGMFIFLHLTLNPQVMTHLYEMLENQQHLNLTVFAMSLENLKDLLTLLPGLTALGLFTTFAVNGVLAQYLLQYQRQNLRPGFRLTTLELPLWPWVGLAIAGLVVLFFHGSLIGNFCLNVVLVLLAAFMLQGMSIFHVFCEGMPQRNLLMWFFYLLMLALPWLVLIVMTLGLFEPWLNLRQKIKKRFRS